MPSKQEAVEELKPRLTTKSTFEAFGSDDMFQDERPKTKNLDDHLQSGKELLGKVGNFFTSSVRKLTTKSNNDQQSGLQDIDKEEERNKSWINNDNTTKIKNGIFSVSKNIGDSLWSLGSKTKKIAVDSGKFIKKNVDGMMNGGDREGRIDEDEVNEGLQNGSDKKFNQYFTDQTGDNRAMDENIKQKKAKEEDDVHFI